MPVPHEDTTDRVSRFKIQISSTETSQGLFMPSDFFWGSVHLDAQSKGKVIDTVEYFL